LYVLFTFSIFIVNLIIFKTKTGIFKNENFTFCKMDVSTDKLSLFLPSKDTSSIDCINLKTNKINHQIKPLESTGFGMLMCIKVIDINRLLVAYENGDICLFDLNTHKQLDCKTFFYGQPILSFDYSIFLNIGYVTCNEITIKKFLINETKIILENDSIQIKNPGINVLKIRPSDSKIFSTGGWDSRIRIYSTKKAKLLCVLDFHNETINSLDFSFQNNILAAASNDGLISFWKLY
jgi:WD40 repeat protein